MYFRMLLFSLTNHLEMLQYMYKIYAGGDFWGSLYYGNYGEVTSKWLYATRI